MQAGNFARFEDSRGSGCYSSRVVLHLGVTDRRKLCDFEGTCCDDSFTNSNVYLAMVG
jgi:hypothetical protein